MIFDHLWEEGQRGSNEDAPAVSSEGEGESSVVGRNSGETEDPASDSSEKLHSEGEGESLAVDRHLSEIEDPASDSPGTPNTAAVLRQRSPSKNEKASTLNDLAIEVQ